MVSTTVLLATMLVTLASGESSLRGDDDEGPPSPDSQPGDENPVLQPASDAARESAPEVVHEPEADRDDPSEAEPPSTSGVGTGARTIVVEPRIPTRTMPDRAGTAVTRRDLDERLPRSAPDALRYEPGVYVQQTAHAQASPYVRGLTGQQTVMFFDGVRLNNSTFRQGPNQYFFTIDSRTIHRLEVVRGSASTRFGSDAMGGALLAFPIEPTLDAARKWTVHPRAFMRTATADGEMGGRAQIDVGWKGKVGVLAGVGYRDVNELRSGGPIIAPATGEEEKSPPAFRSDRKTQRGTGFREWTADSRIVWRPARNQQVTFGYYDYRQLDAPRTDQCPPAEQSENDCLIYLEQFRTLGFASWAAEDARVNERSRIVLSYQNQHELRRHHLGGSSATVNDGDDDVHSLGLRGHALTRSLLLSDWLTVAVDYGADAYFDVIDSQAWTTFTDVQRRFALSRGQYLDGGRYLTAGLWSEAQTTWWDVAKLRGGVRQAFVFAHAEGDHDTQSLAVDELWSATVGNGGLAVEPWPWLALRFNVEQGFRAPNLDDLTSRQQTGPGFQQENPDLIPERSLTLETGFAIKHPWLVLDAWGFRTTIDDLIARAEFDASQCPAQTPECNASRTRLILVNLDEPAVIWGVEGFIRVFFPFDIDLRSSIAWTWGEMQNPLPPSPGSSDRARIPMSRIPPLNGTVELGWRPMDWGFYLAGGLRWALAQYRLSNSDRSDARIPAGGTPGFAVVDIRAGYRWDPHLLVGLVFENVGDAAYRYHGSAVNGPGRGLLVNLEVGF